MSRTMTAEHQRLADSEARRADWKNWGPYLSERAWGTVREDYSAAGEAWDYSPHDHARSRAYRWNEDGLAGVSNRFQNLCLSVGLWNEQDPILKERLFGLTGSQGNHGEDVKEYYYYLDSTPTHSYMKMLYKYPQVEYPYAQLVEENQRRGREVPEFELVDVLRDVFEEGRYFDVTVEYAKAGQEDILCRITGINRGPEPAPIHVLPHLWYRNDWSWGYGRPRPQLRAIGPGTVYTEHRHLGPRWWYVDAPGHYGGDPPDHRRGDPTWSPSPSSPSTRSPLLFTENETNSERLFDVPNATPYVKDGIHQAVVHGRMDQINPDLVGTKVAAHFQASVAPGESLSVRVRFADRAHEDPFGDFDSVFQPPPPEVRKRGRNANWTNVNNLDVLSMPDKWEYPWYAAWDLAFHTLPIALIDPEWAKRQLILLLREWYMHPSGQLPAYEWALGDVNPPVHAWAAWQVYNLTGRDDTAFLEKVFHKLLLNFTWWVNRKDADGNNVFQGGFLGLDNIGVFDRSASLPTGGHIEQADGTAWMAMYSLNMLTIALELARTKPAYEDVATKFLVHFVYIVDAFYDMGGQGVSLWNDEDGFFYDVLHAPDGAFIPLRLRSFVGLIPLLAVQALEPQQLENLPRFRRRMDWLLKYRPHLAAQVAPLSEVGAHGHHQLAIVGRDKLVRILERMFDSDEFLSDYGLRALSRAHAGNPFTCHVGGQTYTVGYEPAESSSGLFGGNSNWRGPIWFPINYLMVEALRKYHHHYGDSLTIEVPKDSGNRLTLGQAADELARRLTRIFLRSSPEGKGETNIGRRPVFGGESLFQKDPHWRDHILFYEYFHGDNGAGIGASHQTGWTALVANLLQEGYDGGCPYCE